MTAVALQGFRCSQTRGYNATLYAIHSHAERIAIADLPDRPSRARENAAIEELGRFLRMASQLPYSRQEVLPMNIPSSLRATAIGLALGSVAFAQSPSPAPPTTPMAPATPPALITQSSRVRAFNPGPGGEVRSLYLQNGSVINVTPGLGGELAPSVRKGAKITVTGTQSEINGQSVVEAASIRLNDETFAANTPSAAPTTTPQSGAPHPPPAPTSRSKHKVVTSTPCAVPADAPPPPDWDGPPPPPDGMAPPPPPPDGMGPPPPPPPQG